MISVRDLFNEVGLSVSGPIKWETPVPELGPGVYVIAEVSGRIIYIGRTGRSIRKRMSEFYRHKYHAKSPHSGGQEILTLTDPKMVYWAPTEEWLDKERIMIAAFCQREGHMPFGNKLNGFSSASASKKPILKKFPSLKRPKGPTQA